MKQLSVIIAVVFLFAACQSKPSIPKYNKKDSFTLSYVTNFNGVRHETGARIDSIYVHGVFKDPDHSLAAYWKIDTNWSITIVTDTLRGQNKKPIYDSIAKSYKLKIEWYKLTKTDLQSISKLHIVE